MGGEDLDVAEAGGEQMGADGVEGALEVVAFAAEVGEKHLPEGVAGDVGEQGGGHLVGEVALAAEDALLEGPGARAAVDEILVVVGFENDELAAAEAFAGDGGGDAEIGGDAESRGAGGQDEPDGIIGIVGEGEGEDRKSVV